MGTTTARALEAAPGVAGPVNAPAMTPTASAQTRAPAAPGAPPGTGSRSRPGSGEANAALIRSGTGTRASQPRCEAITAAKKPPSDDGCV